MNAIIAMLAALGFDLTTIETPAELIPFICITVISIGLFWCMLAIIRYILTRLFGNRLV